MKWLFVITFMIFGGTASLSLAASDQAQNCVYPPAKIEFFWENSQDIDYFLTDDCIRLNLQNSEPDYDQLKREITGFFVSIWGTSVEDLEVKDNYLSKYPLLKLFYAGAAIQGLIDVNPKSILPILYNVESDFKYAAYFIGLLHIERQDYSSASKFLEDARKDGLPEASFALSWMYRKGVYYERSKSASDRLLSEASDRGDVIANTMIMLDVVVDSNEENLSDNLEAHLEKLDGFVRLYNRVQAIRYIRRTMGHLRRSTIENEKKHIIFKILYDYIEKLEQE